MTELMRVKTRWSGFTGGPGYSVMHFRVAQGGDGPGVSVGADNAQQAVDKVFQFFNGMKTVFPEDVKFDVQQEVDVVNDIDGDLITSFTTGSLAQLSGTSSSTYSVVAGAVINWRTAGVRNSRKVRGRTFLVPVAGSAFDTDGQLSSGTVGVVRTLADGLRTPGTGPELVVFARPTTKDAEDGLSYPVTSCTVPQSGAILRSRRD